MRITGWSIDACGHLRDVTVSDLGPRLSVVAGPNESGKTTTLQFLRWVLFGFPTRRDARVKRLEPADGRFGGRVSIRLGERDIVAERHFGDDTPTLSNVDGSPASDLRWSDVVGTAQLELFENVFAVTTDELQRFSNLSSDGVREQIYAASTVGAGVSARTVLSRLESERRDLLAPRSGPIRELHRQLQAALADLGRAQAGASEIETRRRELDELRIRRDDAATTERRALGERDRLAQLLETRADWVEARDARERLVELPEPRALPPEPLAALDRVETRRRTCREQVAAARAALDARTAAIDAIVVDDRLLEMSSEIRRLDGHRVAVEQSRSQLDELLGDLARRRERLARGVSDLGHGISTSSLSTVTTDAAAVSAAAASAADVHEAGQAVRDARTARISADTAAQSARADLRDDLERRRLLADELHVGDEVDDALGAALRLQSLVPKADTPAVAAPAMPARPSAAAGVPTLLWIMTAVAGIGAIVAASVGQWPMGIVLVVVAMSIGTAAFLTGRHAPTPSSDATVHSADSTVLDELHAASTVAGLEPRPTLDQVNDRVRRLDGLRTLDDDIVRRRQQAQRAEDDLTAATQALADAEAAEGARREAWAELAGDLSVPSSVRVADAVEFLRAVQSLQRAAADLDEDEERAHTLRARLGEFDRELAELLSTLDRTTTTDRADLDNAFSELVTDLDESERSHHRLAGLEEDLTELRQRAQLTNDELADADRALAELFADAGVDDTEQFVDAVRADERRRELEATVERFDRHLATRFGDAEAVDAARAELATERVEKWNADLEQLDRVLHTAQENYAAAVLAHHDAEHELERLETSADVATRALEVARRRSELEELVEDWLVASLAHAAVDETLRVFERERQPEVVRQAGASLERITGGRYVGLVPDVDAIEVLLPNGSKLPAESLSRGTTEQLYLAMRFGLARHHASGAALPLILDDVLVNADTARRRSLAEELAHVAEDLQVIVFTCHDETAELLAEHGPDTTIRSIT